MGDTFKFRLGEPVALDISGEVGHVIGRAEYLNSDPQYSVRYKNADGHAIECWWAEDALRSI